MEPLIKMGQMVWIRRRRRCAISKRVLYASSCQGRCAWWCGRSWPSRHWSADTHIQSFSLSSYSLFDSAKLRKMNETTKYCCEATRKQDFWQPSSSLERMAKILFLAKLALRIFGCFAMTDGASANVMEFTPKQIFLLSLHRGVALRGWVCVKFLKLKISN